jgi:hypothetical protein
MGEQQKPIKIKRHRCRNSTRYRLPYITYNVNWTDIFEEIDALKNTVSYPLNTVSNKYSINKSTLRHKYYEWKRNNNNNSENQNDFTDNRGGHNKSFSDSEEYDLYEYIN